MRFHLLASQADVFNGGIIVLVGNIDRLAVATRFLYLTTRLCCIVLVSESDLCTGLDHECIGHRLAARCQHRVMGVLDRLRTKRTRAH
jgi:hypothetical protein